uniref:cingulin-like n=1 Tax=Myxine glutinosa TaxID=7769 RepID=UPI00358E2D3C
MAGQDGWGPVGESEAGSVQDQIEGHEESETARVAGTQNGASQERAVAEPAVSTGFNMQPIDMQALIAQLQAAVQMSMGSQIERLGERLGNRMDAQGERLEGQMGVMRDEARARSEQLGVMRDEARGTSEGLDNNFEELDKKFGKLDNNFEGLDNGIKEVKNGLMGVENRMAAQENQIEGVKNGLEGLENSMEGKLRDMRDQAEREVKQMEQQIEGVRMGVETKLDAHREEMEQMRVASGQEMQVMGEEIRRGVSEEVGGVREEVRHCKEHMEKEVRKGTVKLQGGIEDLTQEVEQLTEGQKELTDQVKKNTAVIGGLKATQNDIKNDLIATKRECQMVREGLTTRLDEVIEVMETKDRQVRTHLETVKVALEDELEETYRGIKEVKHKLEEVEEGMSEIKKRRRGDKKEIKEEIKELVQSLCLDRDDVLINRMRDSQVMEEKRRGRGPGVSGDQYGRAYDAPGDLRSLGVEMDPGVRERPLVKCASNECVPRCSVVRWVTKAVSGMGVPGCVRKGSMGTAGCVSKERAAGCKRPGEASTLDGIEFRTTYSRIGPSVRAGPRFERPRPGSTRRSWQPDRKGRYGDHVLLRRAGRSRSGHWMAPRRGDAWDLGPGKPPSLHRVPDASSRWHKTTSIHCLALRSRALDRDWRTERY